MQTKLSKAFTEFLDEEINEKQYRTFTSLQNNKMKSNKIETSKYNIFTFIPLNLYEQFSKMANLWFLFCGILQMIPEISITDGKPTIFIPLIFVLSITMLKDAYEDFKRYLSDRAENNQTTLSYQSVYQFQQKNWKDIKVGEILKIQKGEQIPADLLLLSSSDPKGICYVETANLDGEVNLKTINTSPEIYKHLDQKGIKFEQSLFNVTCDAPNKNLYQLQGKTTINNQFDIPIDIENCLLRGTSLQNTNFIYGLVIYTGHETKLMKNTFKAKAKFSNLE